MASRYHFRDVPSFGEKLGTSLGAGLGGGLAALAESKLNTLLSRNQREEDKRRLVALGMPEEEANYVSTLDADKQWQYAHRYLITKGSPEENIFPSSLDEDLKITPEMNQQAEEQIRAMGIELPGQEPQNAAQLLTQQTPMSDIMRNALEKSMIQQPKNAMQALQPEPVQAAPQPQVAQLPEPPKEIPKEAKKSVLKPKTRSIAEVFSQTGETASDRKEAGVASRFAFKETKPYVDKVIELHKAKNDEDMILKRIIKTSLNDNARSGLVSEVLQKAGLDFQALKNNDTLELDKLGQWFLRGAKSLFGSRITNNEVNLLLRQVPTMLQSKEGRIRLSNLMLLANEGAHKEYEILQDIIENNGGYAPLNIQRQVAKEMDKETKDLADKFINYIDAGSVQVGSKFDKLPTEGIPNGAIAEGPNGEKLRFDAKIKEWVKV